MAPWTIDGDTHKPKKVFENVRSNGRCVNVREREDEKGGKVQTAQVAHFLPSNLSSAVRTDWPVLPCRWARNWSYRRTTLHRSPGESTALHGHGLDLLV